MLVTYSPAFTPQSKEQSGLGGSCSRAGLSPPRGAPARSRRHHVLPDAPRQGRRRAHGSAGRGSLSCPHETNVHENCRGSTLTQGGGGVAGATSWVSRAREGRREDLHGRTEACHDTSGESVPGKGPMCRSSSGHAFRGIPARSV